MVHGAFNELWGPNELKARWLPALRDGLWHHNVEIDEADAEVCFYGDLFRREPGTEEDRRIEESRAGIADALSDLSGNEMIRALSRLAGEAAFDRTVDRSPSWPRSRTCKLGCGRGWSPWSTAIPG